MNDIFIPPTLLSLRFLPYPPGAARAPQKHPLPQNVSSSMLLSHRPPHREPIPPRSLIRLRRPLRHRATRQLRLLCRLRAASPLGRAEAATASSAEPPAVDYGFGPDAAPRSSARRTTTPQRVPRPRSPLALATAPAPVVPPAQTVPILSGRDRAEPVGTPIAVRSPFPDVLSATTAHLDAFSTAAK